MGLLAEKQSRSRISKDPNNTKWTRDTKTFGQKILRSQGWELGQFLGAQNASHSELHTAANASYIRVALKDDMKGLGYNRAKEDEVTGLDVFSDLLSRLNGKSEESVADDKQARLVVKTNRYVEARWGPMRFVRGGLLVGDEIQAEPTSEESTPTSEADEKPKKSKKDKKSKKRRAADREESESESASADDEKKEKKRKKEERRAKKLVAAAETEDNMADKQGRSRKRSKKDKSKSKPGSGAEDESTDSKRLKRNKKDKKDKKKRKTGETESEDVHSAAASLPTSAATTGTSTPIGSGTGTSTARGSRNFVRSRFIAQKKQAVLDTKALAQIFMVKT